MKLANKKGRKSTYWILKQYSQRHLTSFQVLFPFTHSQIPGIMPQREGNSLRPNRATYFIYVCTSASNTRLKTQLIFFSSRLEINRCLSLHRFFESFPPLQTMHITGWGRWGGNSRGINWPTYVIKF